MIATGLFSDDENVVSKVGSSLGEWEGCMCEIISLRHERVGLPLEALYDGDGKVGEVGILVLRAGELRLGTYMHNVTLKTLRESQGKHK